MTNKTQPEVDNTPALKTHETGCSRSSDSDEVRIDLIPPLAIESVGRVLAKGAKTHGEQNWRKGVKYSVCINHALNHINKFIRGDTSEDHVSHAICNLMFLKEYLTIHPELDDRLGAPAYSDPRSPGEVLR